MLMMVTWKFRGATVSKLDELAKLSKSSISPSKIVQSCMHHYFSSQHHHYWSFLAIQIDQLLPE